jgi:hypothetical protein
MPTLDQVRALALRLPRSARAELIADLVRELAEPPIAGPPALSDEEMREAIQTALDNYRQNPESAKPYGEVMNKLHAMVAEHTR